LRQIAITSLCQKGAGIRREVVNARYGIMPAFQNRLRAEDLRKVAVYVHALGGGEQQEAIRP